MSGWEQPPPGAPPPPGWGAPPPQQQPGGWGAPPPPQYGGPPPAQQPQWAPPPPQPGGGWGAPAQPQGGGWAPPPPTGQYQGGATAASAAASAMSALGADPFVAGLAASALTGGPAAQGSVLDRGAAWASARFGALAPRPGGGVAAALDVTPSYVRTKLAMLATPWAKRWGYARSLEAAPAGGARPAPPARDAAAPDLYIPLMAAATLVLLRGAAVVASGAAPFSPDTLTSAASGAFGVWVAHAAAVKAAAVAVGAGAALPLADLAAYAGYPFAHGCAGCAARLAAAAAGGGGGARRGADAVVALAGAAAGVFLVRSLKRAKFQDARGGGGGLDTSAANYVLLGLWAAQLPLVWWMARGCAG